MLASYCVVCDAEEGECSHRGSRYLDPVVYELSEHGTYKVPEGDELERFLKPPAIAVGTAKPQPLAPWDIQRVVVELEAWVFLDPSLEELLRSCYEANPDRVTRLTENIIDRAKNGKLENPAGLLMKRLREMSDRSRR